MSQSFFNFKMRISSADWVVLSDIMKTENPYYNNKAQRDWFFNQVNRFCRQVAIPFINCNHHPTSIVEKTISIQDAPMEYKDKVRRKNFFNFKMRLSSEDWQLLSRLMTKNSRCVSERVWLEKQVDLLCRDIIIPFLEGEENQVSTLVEKTILIQEIPFAGSTNIELVREFALIKQKSVTQIIQKYIVDARIIQEEQTQRIRLDQSGQDCDPM